MAFPQTGGTIHESAIHRAFAPATRMGKRWGKNDLGGDRPKYL
jgi:hypothetical protein